MKTVLGLTAFTLACCSAGIASAQAQRVSQPSLELGRMSAIQQSYRFDVEEQRRNQVPTPEALEAEYGAERVDLARRVSDLIDQGRCRDARELASAAGERRMVIRIRQTCRQR